ncbi:MAG: hypothetical protein PHY14_02105 [Candidatus Gracilibacteria bacterium]|nr:hypothetical protein [Candidatus Gracilibacteria bacterium]
MKSLTLLIPLLFLSSCSIDWNDEKDTLFTKSLECSKIEKTLLQEKLNTLKNSDLKPKESFYSKTHNSCLFIAVNESTAGKFPDSPEGTLYLFDYNNSKNLSVGMPTKAIEFNEKIQELKGE